MKHAEDALAVPDPLKPGLLAATAAHELNNIVASLRGFVELAIENAGSETSQGRILGEVDIGVDRVIALATDMQMLACAPAERAVLSLRECVEGERKIVWDCDAATTVLVNSLQVRKVLSHLVHPADRAGSDGCAIRCHVPGHATKIACLSCGTRLADKDVWLSVWPVQGLRDPSRASRKERPYVSGPELRTLAVAHLAHCAGGHLVSDPDPETFSLVLPRP